MGPWVFGFWALAALAMLLASLRPLGVRWRWGLVSIGLILEIRYLTWRGLSTLVLSPSSIAMSLALFAAEVYGLVQLLLFYFQVARPTNPRASLGDLTYFPTVDVFIPTYDEPLEVISRTAACCLRMVYPKKTVYVLDDGRRAEVATLAERLGCRYLSRPRNINAKAGNINNALAQTEGELVVMFDADHAPVQTFLQETIGFFRDPRVAFVQTVQHFYNPDPFQRNLLFHRVFSNEQDLFFKEIMPGRDRYNAAFWTGSGAIFRRRALQEVGGVLPQTLTEDLHTSLELHSRGWRSIHLNRVLSAGLSPESYSSYIRQRLRWTHGTMQVWWRANPLFKRGLSLGQRLCYYASVHYFFFGWARLAFLLAPLAFLLFGVMPLKATPLQIAIYYLPKLAVFQAVFPLVSGGRRMIMASDLYETAICFFQAPTALKALLFPRSGVFRVTPKGERHPRRRLRLSLAFPQIGLALLLVGGIGLGLLKLNLGLADRNATVINGTWALYNLLLAVEAILVARELPQRRRAHRLSLHFPCEVVAGGLTVAGRTTDISEAGAAVRLKSVPLPPMLRLRFFLPGRQSLEVTAAVVRSQVTGGEQEVGLRFLPLSAREQNDLVHLLHGYSRAWEEAEPPPRVRLWQAVGRLVSFPLKVAPSLRPQRRRYARFRTDLPAEVILEKDAIPVRARDISMEGLGLMADVKRLPQPGRLVGITLPWDGKAFHLRGEVVWVAALGNEARLGVALRLNEQERYLWGTGQPLLRGGEGEKKVGTESASWSGGGG
jgi:cellulose synthase (UDP-forming)